MPAIYLLDTSILSQPIKDKPLLPVLERWSEIGEAAVCTSAICIAEILQGLEERGSQKYWRRYRELLEGRYRVLPFDEAVAGEFGKLSAKLRSLGTPKPMMDLLIASTAKSHGLVLATLNPKDFLGIPDLKVQSWL